jgi:hypothetical protein
MGQVDIVVVSHTMVEVMVITVVMVDIRDRE